jgi:hypothetical protein
MPSCRRKLALLLVAAGLAISASHAGEIQLTWDPVQGASGYRVYYGSSSGVYGSSITVSGPSATITGLTDCATHFVAVKAFNGAGESSQFSNEITGWPRPAITNSSTVRVMQGQQAVLDIYGSNFQSGASVDLEDPQIVTGTASVLSCTHLQVLATVEPTSANVQPAQVGLHDVTVANPDDVYGLQAAGFEVLINPARFDINKSDPATANRIDGKDTIYLSRIFASSKTSPLYDPDYDFDGDGWVDGADLTYIAINLGRCWSSSSGTWSASACPAGLR